jgi:putative addiction module CopG family antidote
MNVPIPNDLESFIEELIRTGSYHDPSEIVGEALRALKRQEQLRRAVQLGVDELDRGEYIEYDDASLAKFVEDIKKLEETRYVGKDKV